MGSYLGILRDDPFTVEAVGPELAFPVGGCVIQAAVGAARSMRAWQSPIGFGDRGIMVGVPFAGAAVQTVELLFMGARADRAARLISLACLDGVPPPPAMSAEGGTGVSGRSANVAGSPIE